MFGAFGFGGFASWVDCGLPLLVCAIWNSEIVVCACRTWNPGGRLRVGFAISELHVCVGSSGTVR